MPATHILKEKSNQEHFSRFFSFVSPADKTALHRIIFAVAQSNLDRLTQILHDISDPSGMYYGRHWTKQEVADFTRNTLSYSIVMNHLRSNKYITIDRETINGEYIFVTAPVHVWEEMLSTTFNVYRYLISNQVRTIIRAEDYSLPAHLFPHIFAVFNTVQFFHPITVKKANPIATEGFHNNGASLQGLVTPAVINEVYGITSNTGSLTVSQAVYESDSQAFSPTDLTTFQKYFNIPVQPVSEDIGGHMFDNACQMSGSSINNCDEANLDVQYIMGIAQNTYTIFHYSSDTSSDWMLSWITSVADSASPANVYSISYGNVEYAYSKAFVQAFNTEAIKLGIIGTTIVASSGDDGAVSSMARNASRYCGYFPDFPASSLRGRWSNQCIFLV